MYRHATRHQRSSCHPSENASGIPYSYSWDGQDQLVPTGSKPRTLMNLDSTVLQPLHSKAVYTRRFLTGSYMTPCYLKPATSSLLVRSCVVLSWAMLSPGCTVCDTTPPQAKPVSGTGGESHKLLVHPVQGLTILSHINSSSPCMQCCKKSQTTVHKILDASENVETKAMPPKRHFSHS